jgi:tetratricopeptide (TPR) repeat protein
VGPVTEQSEHLSNAQIENYGNRASGAGPDADQRDKDQTVDTTRVDDHLANCPSCRNRLLDFHRARFGLVETADPQVKTAPTSECPSEDALRQLAAGLSPDAFSAQIARHAAACDHCGPLLRTFTEDFSDDFSSEEQAVLAKLQGSSTQWQKDTARQMMQAGAGAVAAPATRANSAAKSPGRSFSWKWFLIPATAAVFAIAVLGIWYTQRDTPEKVEKLLAQAYTEQRTMEMRWPGADHSEIHQTRSGESGSILNAPESLRTAASEINLHLKRNRDDSKWLLLSARLHLIEGHYQPAFSDLSKIDDDKAAAAPEYLMTRALALYEKAESEPDGRQFYGEAVDLLGKILQQNPDNPVALFDQALACERIFAFDCASSDWERLLKVEKDSHWALEARQHLKRIQEKKTLEH